MILPLQGDALMGVAVTPRALPWARRSLAFQAAKHAEYPYPTRQRPYTANGPYPRLCRLTRAKRF